MEGQDFTQKIEVEVPRSQLITLRTLFEGIGVKQAIEKCVETFSKGWQAGIELSKEAVLEVSSLLNVASFNSEASLLEAIRQRLKVKPSTVVLEIDEMLAVSVRATAKGNGISFNQCVQNYLQAAFANGFFNQDWNLHSLFFDAKQWEQMKKALGTVPSTGENLARIVSEWRHMKGQITTEPVAAIQVGTPKIPELVVEESTSAIPTF